MLEVEDLGDFVYVWGDGTLEDLIAIIQKYKELGFNQVWHGYDNSTLCIQKIKDSN